MKRDGIIIYVQQYEAIKDLSQSDKGLLLDAIFHYHITGEVMQELPPMVLMAFTFIRTSIDSNTRKYETIVERNRKNGKKGGRPRNPNNPSEPKKPTGLKITQANPNNPNNPSEPKKADTDTDTVKDKKTKTGKEARSFPPTIDEIKDYCVKRNNSVDANIFFDFYESNGWLVGKNKMKDWKASVRTWENRENNKYSSNNGNGKTTPTRRATEILE